MQSELDQLMTRIWQRKIPFLVVFFVVVMATYGFLVIIDFVPEPIDEVANNKETATQEIKPATAMTDPEEIEKIETNPLPVKIIFDALDKEIDVLNPTEPTIPAMDEALLSGAVRHPDSADFVKTGNMLILGHSSYIPNVLNKNFQAFNGIQKMKWGDIIRLQSDDTEYVYFVERIREEKATEVVVPYDWGEGRLTLVTCNSFGAKEDRFIVEAKLIDQKPL